MLYGAYKNLRNAAWQVLIDYNIDALPVDLRSICKKTGIKIIKDSTVHLLLPLQSGISILNGNKWYIIYADDQSVERCRFTVAHELGHIFLGHQLVSGYHARTFDVSRPQTEQEADMFAARLLAPSCVLWGLDLRMPEEIAAACKISYSAAYARADRMKILYRRNKFLTSPVEREVYKNFSKYIQKNRR